MGSHWRFLNKKVTESNVSFNKIIPTVMLKVDSRTAMKGAETSQEAVIVSWVRGQGGKAEIVGIKGVPTMY